MKTDFLLLLGHGCNVCTPFLIDAFSSEITFQDVFPIIRDSHLIGMMAVFLSHDGTQSLNCHMALNPFQDAGSTAVIQAAADFDCPIPLFGIVIGFFYLFGECFIFLLPVHLMCPYEYYDVYPDMVVHPGGDVRICNLRGVVVWRDSECRMCLHGKM